MSTEIKEKAIEKTQKEDPALLAKPITTRSRSYILEYRHKNRMGITNGQVKQKAFWFDGNLKQAVDRIREHCKRMDYTFIYCRPFIVDLESQEKLKSINSDYDTNIFDEDEVHQGATT